MIQSAPPDPADLEVFEKLLDENRYDFCKLVYILFPFGVPNHPLEHMAPYDWQMDQWAKLSKHLSNPETRYELYRLIISSGNGAAKTAFGAMTILMLMYTQQLRGRITANTDPQMKTIVWPEYDVWFRHARFSEFFFEKLGTSIKARNEKLAETWRFDTITWSEETPTAMSGLHNKGKAVAYVFEEAPGIPANIWKYASGAFTETQTIKLFMAFGNSDDPESMFEQNMDSPLWNSLRIDTRTLSHIDPKQIQDWLLDCNGNEDHDDFRVRVRGMPRKTAKDSIISLENVTAAIDRARDFDTDQVAELPCILTCDPAWQGGDDCVIAYRQGPYSCILDKYKLDRAAGETHNLTYQKLCYWENQIHADCVLIDQGEGTALMTLAQNNDKTNWFLVSFASLPNDTPEHKDSQYGNIRAQMYYEFNDFLAKGGVLDAKNPEWIPLLIKQLCWTKGTRHKVTLKKMAESKLDIKKRVWQSPDLADACVLQMAMKINERKPENTMMHDRDHLLTGQQPYRMPDHELPYGEMSIGEIIDIYD